MKARSTYICIYVYTYVCVCIYIGGFVLLTSIVPVMWLICGYVYLLGSVGCAWAAVGIGWICAVAVLLLPFALWWITVVP